jgi:hypothetical protein
MDAEQPQDREVWEHFDADCARCVEGYRPEFDEDQGYWWHDVGDRTVRCGARWCPRA